MQRVSHGFPSFSRLEMATFRSAKPFKPAMFKVFASNLRLLNFLISHSTWVLGNVQRQLVVVLLLLLLPLTVGRSHEVSTERAVRDEALLRVVVLVVHRAHLEAKMRSRQSAVPSRNGPNSAEMLY